jgi:hypothetical protein
VLIWLNGPFGIGKTSTAEALIRRLPGAILFDPEPVGLMFRDMYRSVEPVDDFQDLQAWRAAVPALVRVLRQSNAATLVMPMTVWRRDYFTEILTALRDADDDVRCFRVSHSLYGPVVDELTSSRICEAVVCAVPDAPGRDDSEDQSQTARPINARTHRVATVAQFGPSSLKEPGWQYPQ